MLLLVELITSMHDDGVAQYVVSNSPKVIIHSDLSCYPEFILIDTARSVIFVYNSILYSICILTSEPSKREVQLQQKWSSL